MSKIVKRSQLVKAVAGFVVGVALWLGFGSFWERLLAPPAELLLRITESPSVTRLAAVDEGVVVDRSDFRSGSVRPVIRARDLTFNAVLLIALFAMGRTFTDRNISRFLIAVLILYLIHILFLFVRVKSIYALQFGAWSSANYGAVARNVWAFADHFYRIVGMYAFVFALWWWLGDRAGWRLRKRG